MNRRVFVMSTFAVVVMRRYASMVSYLTFVLSLDTCITHLFFIWWLGMAVLHDYNISLRKHAYSNIKKTSPPKTENFR